jgi:signal transduction histidine kinase
VGKALPHWQIAVFGSPLLESNTFFYTTVGLVILLALLIALCTLILVRQVRAGLLVAQQKTTFVANVSHELKTPLTSIRMFAELLATDRVKEPEKRRHYLEVMVQESERLSRLVNNVLDFSRLEQGRRDYQISDFALAPYLESFRELKALQLTETNASLTLEPLDVEVRADRDALNQILLNLVDNALKYGRSASGEAVIRIVVSDLGERVAIAVEDQGAGVPDHLRRRVFEKFFRAEASLTTTTSGSGIGLTLARLLAEGMGGSLDCEAAAAGGARFVLCLPAGVQKPTESRN